MLPLTLVFYSRRLLCVRCLRNALLRYNITKLSVCRFFVSLGFLAPVGKRMRRYSLMTTRI